MDFAPQIVHFSGHGAAEEGGACHLYGFRKLWPLVFRKLWSVALSGYLKTQLE